MAAIESERLNSLFVLLHRSLLQYVGECWPWTAEDGQQAEKMAAFRAVVEAQEKDETLLADALNASGWVINCGGYPTIYTDLHYVSLAYLLKQIIISQTAIVKAFEAASQSAPDCPLLATVTAGEREILKTVQALAAPQPLATAS